MRRREDDLVAWADDPVVRALTAPAQPFEVDGGEEVFAAFRAANATSRRTHSRILRRVGGAGITAIVAVTALSGAAAAAYVQVLPDPMQQAFHDIFYPLQHIGLPSPKAPVTASSASRAGHKLQSAATGGRHSNGLNSGASAPVAGPVPTSQPSASPASSTSPSPAAAAQTTPSASPSPSATPQLTISASAPKHIGYERQFAVTGVVKYGGNVSANRYASLWIKRFEDSQWSKLGSTEQTDTSGRVSFTVTGFDENTNVQLRTGGGKVHSGVHQVVVLPRVSVSIAAASNGTDDKVTITTAGARPGDVVYLDRQSSAGWTTRVQSAKLNAHGKATFTIPMPATGSRTYRVRVVATSVHGTGSKVFALSA